MPILFKAITRVPKHVSKGRCDHHEFIDWYTGTEAEAKEQWQEDCHRYGIDIAKAKVEFIECDSETLKPLPIYRLVNTNHPAEHITVAARNEAEALERAKSFLPHDSAWEIVKPSAIPSGINIGAWRMS